MRRARGFGLELYLAAVVAGGLALTGAYFYGRHDGAALEIARWEKRDNDELRRVNAELDAAHRKLRDQEHAAADRLQQVSGEYQRELTDVREQTRSRLAAVAAGFRLRDPAAAAAVCPGGVPGVAAGAGGRNGAAPGDLSGEATAFLLQLAGEADEVAKQLKACQDVVRADRADRPPIGSDPKKGDK